MLFSIVVPIYKTETLLKRCADSILRQSFSDIEVILVDDGSPDGSPKLCDEYAAQDARVRVIHKENGGLSDARNKGLEIATGEYVIFVDSDDYIEEDACEQFAKYAETGADVLIGDGVTEGGVADLSHCKELTGRTISGAEFLKYSYRRGEPPMAAWLNAYKREFLLNEGLKFAYRLLHEDEEFTPRVFLAASSVVCTGKVFYHYIIRENSISTQKDMRKNAEHLFQTLDFLNGIYQKLSDKKLRNLLYDSLAVKYLNMFFVGNLIAYGKTYIKKSFVFKRAKRRKTVIKAWIFCISPRLYCWLNRRSKR